MVSSEADDVDHYLAEIPDAHRAAMEGLRDLFRSELGGFAEVMAHGMPTYRRDGTVSAGFALQKRYVSIYVLREDVIAAFADRLAGHDRGKGCLRFRRPEDIDTDLVRDLLRAVAAGPGPVC
ncbi:iron chaperone [Nocardiopsis sp. MG754419]|uniref:iron chaperone n=1 Tax=Nocardiopsis sp. MG754419 TaxID=2259865 RepID=UPI001BAD8107|nr:DUF1801 domain-containing protein [Nocardiopsis sp. MG754419]MBR8743460.1 DUF1801 domain-containing protein [Nocardiopsis sp. MG754419]